MLAGEQRFAMGSAPNFYLVVQGMGAFLSILLFGLLHKTAFWRRLVVSYFVGLFVAVILTIFLAFSLNAEAWSILRQLRQ